MESKNVLGLLSEYQSKMVKTIFECEGSVDKFIGDAVMAVSNDMSNIKAYVERLESRPAFKKAIETQ